MPVEQSFQNASLVLDGDWLPHCQPLTQSPRAYVVPPSFSGSLLHPDSAALVEMQVAVERDGQALRADEDPGSTAGGGPTDADPSIFWKKSACFPHFVRVTPGDGWRSA